MALLKKNDPGNLNGWVFIAIIISGFALYFIPLQSKTFYFDDHVSIEKDDVIKKIDIPRIFNAFNTRSLVGLSFALNYKWCALNPAGYRLVNILIHCLNAFLVYLLIKATLYLYPVRKSAGGNEWPAFFGAMLFLCHPLQTEPVNFITQRFVLMGSFFYLLTLYLYVQYRCRKQKRYLIASMTSAIAAMFCKEFVVTLPFMLVLYEFYFLDALAEPWWKRCRRIVPFLIIILIVPLLLLRTTSKAVDVANIADSDTVQENGSQGAGSHIDITRAHGGISREQYFLTELNVVCTYVRLLFLPIHQNLDYDYPISQGIDDKTALCGVFLLSLLVLAALTYKTYRIVSFSILWFFITLSVESSFIPIGHVIAEYRVYLASVGFVFLVMNLIYMRQADVKKLNIVVAVIIVGLSVLTYQRNKVWQDEFSLWNDTVQKSPHKARPYNNRGFEYYQRGDFTHAMVDLNAAIAINPKYADAYYNRGVIYDKQNDPIQAISDYNKAIEFNPNYAEAYNNLGSTLGQQGNFYQAILEYTKSIEIDPNYAEAYDNRGVVYYKQGHWTQALADYNRAIEIDPQLAKSYINRGIYYDSQGNLSQAVSDFTKTIETKPDDAEAYDNRGVVYYKQGQWTQALADYNRAIEIDPDLAEAYLNRGIYYDKQNDLSQAISDYSKAIEIDPNNVEAYNNRGSVYGDQGHWTQAMSDFNEVIGIKPDYAGAYNNRAAGYYALKEYDKAWADVRKAGALGAVVNPNLINGLKQASVDHGTP